MSEKVKKVKNYVVEIEWHTLLMALFMLVSGVAISLTFTNSIANMSIVIGLVAILKGFFNFNLYSASFSLTTSTKWQWLFLVAASVNILFGLVTIFNFSSNLTLLYIVTGIWFIIDCIPHLIVIHALYLKDSFPHKLYTTLYTVAIFCGIGLLLTSKFQVIPASIFVGIYFIICGGILFKESHEAYISRENVFS